VDGPLAVKEYSHYPLRQNRFPLSGVIRVGNRWFNGQRVGEEKQHHAKMEEERDRDGRKDSRDDGCERLMCNIAYTQVCWRLRKVAAILQRLILRVNMYTQEASLFKGNAGSILGEDGHDIYRYA